MGNRTRASPALVHQLLVTRQLRDEDMPNAHPTTAAMPGLNPKGTKFAQLYNPMLGNWLDGDLVCAARTGHAFIPDNA